MFSKFQPGSQSRFWPGTRKFSNTSRGLEPCRGHLERSVLTEIQWYSAPIAELYIAALDQYKAFKKCTPIPQKLSEFAAHRASTIVGDEDCWGSEQIKSQW